QPRAAALDVRDHEMREQGLSQRDVRDLREAAELKGVRNHELGLLRGPHGPGQLSANASPDEGPLTVYPEVVAGIQVRDETHGPPQRAAADIEEHVPRA